MKYRSVRFLSVCLCLMALSIVSFGQGIKTDQFRPWKLAFVRNGDIWTARGDGSGSKRIIKNGFSPAWSPDKKRIAFARDNNVWVANSDGTKQKKLTHFPDKRPDVYSVQDIQISWRSRIDQITFSHTERISIERLSDKRKDKIEATSIFDIDPKTGKMTTRFDVFDTPDGDSHYTYSSSPSWSKDGNKLLFVRNGDIWIADRYESSDPLDPPGWTITRLAAVAEYDEATWRANAANDEARNLSVSPDGKYLVYSYGRYFYDAALHLMRLHGTGESSKLLTSEETTSMWPSFSPDSKYVVYQSPDDSGKFAIWVLSIETGNRIRLIANGQQPAW